MFRPMRRWKQQLSDEDCIAILEKELEICTNLCQKFTDDKAYLEHELQHSRPNVLCLALTPEHMTGKLVKES